ncbi:MAG TPA: hypothetical protein VKY27_06100 [Bacteriovoracaceae bacterium]|nr:hypothetical protein [Bacteriovoracaceae bacterium]
MNLKFVPVIEEQMCVNFTGKVNLLSPFNHQYLGHLLFKDGKIIDVKYQHLSGLRAFFQLGIREHNLEKHMYVVEPEVVSEEEQRIHYPFSVLQTKLEKQIKLYEIVHRQRPPQNVKIIVNAASIGSDFECTPEEFKVLSTLTEVNDVNDIYEICPLLEHEVTSALINLRKKGVLKIVGRK